MKRDVVSLLVILLAEVTGQPLSSEEGPKQCEEITIGMCRGIGYNYTYMPNQFRHDNQEEAELEIGHFLPLVEVQCSPDLKYFLCSMYAPICLTTYQKPLTACRSVCERAKAGCAPFMRKSGFAWPERMRCADLPEASDKRRLCMDFNLSTAAATGHRGPGSRVTSSTKDQNRTTDCRCLCRPPLVRITDQSDPYFGKITTGEVLNCAVPCDGIFFREEDKKRFVRVWIGLWSIACLASTGLTVFTFLVDMKRFRYPERAIVYLSLCYAFVSLGYILRLIIGHSAVACDDHPHGGGGGGGGGTQGLAEAAVDGIGGLRRGDGGGDARTIRYYTAGPVGCTVVFLLVYFFGMASSIWWVVLTLSWFLAAGLKWSQEAIDGYARYFHLAAWLLPSIKTVAVLALSAVDGDPIAGICYVGNQDVNLLRGFVLAPLCVHLVVGTSFLVSGFVSLFRIRGIIRRQGQTPTEKLERFMIRIGVFSVMYTVPAIAVIGCHLYEQHFRHRWEVTFNCPCVDGTDMAAAAAGPRHWIFMLKYFMCLVVGITSGFWIWSKKTLDGWRQCYHRVCKGGTKDKVTTSPSRGELASTTFVDRTRYSRTPHAQDLTKSNVGINFSVSQI